MTDLQMTLSSTPPGGGSVVHSTESVHDSQCDKDFLMISECLGAARRMSDHRVVLAEGNSLALLKRLPDHCISLVLTDPPYHVTKKENIRGDTDFTTDNEYINWFGTYAAEWKRVLRNNGSIFCFCDPRMAARLEVMMSSHFNILSHITWTKPNAPGFDGWKQKMKKDSLRKWYAHSERIIFGEPIFARERRQVSFGVLLRDARISARMSAKDLTAAIGAYGRVNHGGAVSNWETGRNIPSRYQYERLRDILSTNVDVSMPEYEFAVRPFSVDATKEFTDVWTFETVRPYKGKHPAEKPIALLEHAITATTFPGDIVLDCFSGSGSTGVAAMRAGRRSVLIEIEPQWVARTQQRVSSCAVGK